MRRIVGALFAVGLGMGAAAAQETALELKEPELSARTNCPPLLQARCAGITQRGLDHDLACDRCLPEVMPTEIVNPPAPTSTPAQKRNDGARPLECSLAEMPLGPTPPGCARPPLDHVPLP
jgi:hypothetical protein